MGSTIEAISRTHRIDGYCKLSIVRVYFVIASFGVLIFHVATFVLTLFRRVYATGPCQTRTSNLLELDFQWSSSSPPKRARL